MVADGVCIKGVVLQARVTHVRESYGEAALGEVLGLMFDSDRALLGSLVVPALWYPVALAIRLDQAICAYFGPGPERIVFRNIGRTLANLSCANATMLRRGDPHHALRASAQLYSLHYRYGQRAYERIDQRCCRFTTSGPEAIAIADCLTTHGFLERVVELSGALDARIDERQCRLQGAAWCVHSCEWSVAGVALSGLSASP